MTDQEIRDRVDEVFRLIVAGEFSEYGLKELGKELDLNSSYGLHVYTNLCITFGKYKALEVAKKQAESLVYWIERS